MSNILSNLNDYLEGVSNLWPDPPKPGQMIPTWHHLEPKPYVQPEVKDPNATADFIDSLTGLDSKLPPMPTGQIMSKPDNILDAERFQAGVFPPPDKPESSIPESVAKVAQKALKRASKSDPSRQPSTPTPPEEPKAKDENKPYSSAQQLLAALKASAENASNANLLQGAMKVGSAIARTEPNYDGLAELRKTGQEPVEQFNALQKNKVQDLGIEKALQERKLLASELDPDSDVSKVVRDQLYNMGLQVSPNTSAKQLRDQGVDIGKLLTAQQASKDRELRAKELSSYRDSLLGQKQSLQDQRIHDQVVRRIDNNPNVRNRIQQIQNLDNAMAILQAFPEGATPQQISDAQQLIIRNMGIQGSSGVGERAERYIHTAGMKGAGLLQFITGDPVMLSQNSKLMNYIRKQASTERENGNTQLMNTISAVAAGHGSLYKRNPELLEDLKDKFSQYHDVMSNPISGQQTGTNEPHEGMTVIQNGHTYTYRNGKWE